MPRQKSNHVDSVEGVAVRLREARRRAGLHQSELAFQGCTAAYISRIEAGKRIPSLQLLRELGRRLGVSADWLATGEEPSLASLDVIDARLALRLGKLEEGRTLFEALLASADPDVRRAALLGLGEIAIREGRLDRAIDLLEEHQGGAAQDPVEPAAVEALVHAYVTRGDHAKALNLLGASLEQAADDPLARFRLSVTMANLLIDLGEFERAELTIAEALNELGPTPEPLPLARCLWSQSRLQTARGNLDVAARYAEQALAIVGATEHAEYAARAQQLIAHIELDRGNPARALELLNEAARPIMDGGDTTAIALFNVERARALAALGEIEEARAIALALVQELEQLSYVDAARALGVLADLLADAGSVDEALALYETAADRLADRPHAPMLVGLYDRWFELLAKAGQTEKALDVARRGLRARSGIPTQH